MECHGDLVRRFIHNCLRISPNVRSNFVPSSSQRDAFIRHNCDEVGTKLVQNWYEVGTKLGRSWCEVGPKLVRSWYEVWGRSDGRGPHNIPYKVVAAPPQNFVTAFTFAEHPGEQSWCFGRGAPVLPRPIFSTGRASALRSKMKFDWKVRSVGKVVGRFWSAFAIWVILKRE